MSEALQRVAFGLKLINYGYVVMLLDVFVGVAGSCIVTLTRAANYADTVMLVIVVGMYLIGSFLGFVGRICCLSVPATYGRAKKLLLFAVALEIMASILCSMAILLEFAMHLLAFEMMLFVSWAIFNFMSLTLFILFCRDLADSIHHSRAANKADTILVMIVFALVIGIVSGVITYLLSEAKTEFMHWVLVISACITVVLPAGLSAFAFYKYLSLIWELAEVAKRYAKIEIADVEQ
jgi:hypothetical protein